MQMKTCKLMCKNAKKSKSKCKKCKWMKKERQISFIQKIWVCGKEPLECGTSNRTLIFHGG